MLLHALFVLIQALPLLTFASPILHSRTNRTLVIDATTTIACSTGSINIDPSYPQDYIDQFCGMVSASTPDWLIKISGLPQGAINIVYAWEAAGDNYDQKCSTACADAFADLITECEYDSHNINGVATYTEACGQFVLQINPEPSS